MTNCDTYEVCPYCDEEVLLKNAKVRVFMNCPNCGKSILPCSLCHKYDKCNECNSKLLKEEQ